MNGTLTKFSTTAFIVGAGAHAPYGFPTSVQLTEKITSLYKFAPRVMVKKSYSGSILGNSPVFPIKRSDVEIEARDYKAEICSLIKTLEIVERPAGTDDDEYGIHIENVLNQFLITFAGAQVDSIDAFLAQRSMADSVDHQTIKIGKLIISYFITKFETRSPVGFHSKNWIQHITNDFLKNPAFREEFFARPPKIYTFNYDNFFEKSLYTHLISFHRITPERAKKMVLDLGIVHIYGHVNSFEHMDSGITKQQFYQDAIKRIKVIGEERNTSDLSPQIRNALTATLRSAERVYFLGFGFDDQNVSVLFGDESSRKISARHNDFSKTEFVSTKFNLSSHEISQIAARLPFPVRFFEGEENSDCLHVLKEMQPVFRFYDDAVDESYAYHSDMESDDPFID